MGDFDNAGTLVGWGRNGWGEEPYGDSFNQINMLGGVDLHDAGFLGEGIVISVFDAGFTGVETLPIFDNLWENHVFGAFSDCVGAFSVR